MSHTNNSGKVYLVGAGPGDPELLTVRAARLLAEADVVLHDDLVTQEILAHASSHAVIDNVGKRCGRKNITQEEIHARMIDAARAGCSVVRLKSGDPLIFGRAQEEIDALHSAGIDVEVVPGITAAFAAAAALGRSLTDRRSAGSVVIRSGHHATTGNGSGNSAASAAGITRCVYMPTNRYAELADEWLAAGESTALPCVVVSKASRADQQVLRTTLGELASVPTLEAPSILLAGPTLADMPEDSADFAQLVTSAAAI